MGQQPEKWATRIPPKNGGKLRCSWRLCSSCFL